MASYLLNKSGIKELLTVDDEHFIYDAIEGVPEEPGRFKDTKSYCDALDSSNSKVIVEDTQNSVLGHCRLRIMVGEHLPKKVAFLRNGMLITDSLYGLIRFYNYKDFVAVFECCNSKGNALLRGMEPPRHDTFEPDRLSADKQQEGKRALKQITAWVREKLKQHATNPVEENTVIDELSNYFGAESDVKGGGKDEEINPSGNIKITAKPIKRKIISARFSDDSDDSSGSGGRKGRESRNKGGATGNGADGSGGKGANKGGKGISLSNIRLSSYSGDQVSLYFTPSKTATMSIKLQMAGADSDYDIPVLESDRGKLEDGCIIYSGTKGERVAIRLKVSTNTKTAIKVLADEI